MIMWGQPPPAVQSSKARRPARSQECPAPSMGARRMRFDRLCSIRLRPRFGLLWRKVKSV